MVKKPNCIECNKETSAKHDILNIALCRECRKNIEKYTMITKTTGLKDYCLKESELLTLKFIERKNPYYSSAAPMKLFLKSQVADLALKKWGSLSKLKDELNRRENLGKKIREGKANAKRKRKEDLKTALEEVGLELRTDSTLCDAYIRAKTFHTIPEIVSIMEKAHERHQKTPYDYLWEKYQKKIEQEAEENYYYYGNWTEAWEETKSKWREKIMDEAYSKANL